MDARKSRREIAIAMATRLTLGICGGACLFDENGNGLCDDEEVLGCTFNIACNFNPDATIEDGSCIFYCPGCLDEVACNFNPTALQDDGSCEYPEDLGWCDCSGETNVDAIGICGGDCQEDIDGDGICDDIDDC